MVAARSLFLIVVIAGLLLVVGCDNRKEAVREVVEAQARKAAGEVAAERAKENAQRLAKSIAEDIRKSDAEAKALANPTKDEGLPPSELARRAFLENLKTQGVSPQDARKAWIDNLDKAKKQFIERLMKATNVSAERAEEVWHHGE
jgi:hypothetical protein